MRNNYTLRITFALVMIPTQYLAFHNVMALPPCHDLGWLTWDMSDLNYVGFIWAYFFFFKNPTCLVLTTFLFCFLWHDLSTRTVWWLHSVQMAARNEHVNNSETSVFERHDIYQVYFFVLFLLLIWTCLMQNVLMACLVSILHCTWLRKTCIL